MIALARTAFALTIVLAGLEQAAAVERILSFVNDVVVERNGDLAVTESIRVQVEGIEIRRGILRDFPTTYTRSDGTRVVVGFDVVSVDRDGAPEPYTTERLANGVRVRIGQADQMLARRAHDYVIRYRATRQIGFFAAHDELYWNATGTGWTFPIDAAEVRITLPEPVPFGLTAFYTGSQGARGQDARIVAQQPGRVVFRTTRPLPAKNGLTVVAGWQKGLIEPPTGVRQAGWWLSDNLAHAVAGLGLTLVLGFYGLAWARVGRDPARGTIIPLFAPPAGMSAAAVRYVDRMGFDDRCFAAAIVDLGVNGHLKMTGSGGNTLLERRDGGREIARAERDTAHKLFGTNSSVMLHDANYERIGNAKDTLRDRLSHAYSGKLFTDNLAWSVLGFVLVIMVALAIAVATYTSIGGDRGATMVVGMLIPVIPVMIGARTIAAARRGGANWMFPLVGVLMALVGLGIGLVILVQAAGSPFAALPGLVPSALAPFAILGFGWLQAPTRAGRKVMDQIGGFRQYLGVAEEDRLEFLHPPEKTPELFERFLPYAIALDVENTWAKRFAGVLAAAGVGAAAGSALSTWHSGSDNDPVAVAESLGGLSDTISSASTPPGSSSSGSGGGDSGGSSGGGGGGGGGSGW
jgi:uncharacterized membrane protein YgcG